MPVLPVATIDAITFTSRPAEIFVPAREVAKQLGWPLEYDSVVQLAKLKGKTLSPLEPQLSDGTVLVTLKDLAELGAKVSARKVQSGGKVFLIRIGPKKVSVDLKAQILK